MVKRFGTNELRFVGCVTEKYLEGCQKCEFASEAKPQIRESGQRDRQEVKIVPTKLRSTAREHLMYVWSSRGPV